MIVRYPYMDINDKWLKSLEPYFRLLDMVNDLNRVYDSLRIYHHDASTDIIDEDTCRAIRDLVSDKDEQSYRDFDDGYESEWDGDSDDYQRIYR